MATVSSFTAERMLEIENSTIVDGNIVGDNLILKRRDDVTIDAGNIRGPTGLPGVTEAQLIVQLEIACPSATVRMTMSSVADPGWVLLNGQVVVNCEGLYPSLWSKLPVVYKSGSNFNTPNMTTSFPIGGTPGTFGGSNTKTIIANNLPSHVHSGTSGINSVDHSHSGTTGNVSADHTHSGTTSGQSTSHSHLNNFNTSNNGNHNHASGGDNFALAQNTIGDQFVRGGDGFHMQYSMLTENGGAHAHNVYGQSDNASVDHSHTITTGGISANHNHAFGTGGVSANHNHAFSTDGGPGTSAPLDITPAWIAFGFQIKAH